MRHAGTLPHGLIGLVCCGSLLLAGCVSMPVAESERAETTPAAVTESVSFEDPKLERIIRRVIGQPNGELLSADLLEVTVLWMWIFEDSTDLTSIGGLEQCVNLGSLLLAPGGIVDLTPLSGLRDLQMLDLSFNRVVDLTPVAALNSLQGLLVTGNPIEDLSPIAALTGLTELGLGSLGLDDLGPVSGLTSLRALLLSDNTISDIGALAGLTRLSVLDLSGNRIAGLSPLAGMTELAVLNLNGNQIGDLTPLSGLTELSRLDLADNRIEDLSPLAGLVNLTRLDLANNQISDLTPLFALKSLEELELAGNSLGSEELARLKSALPECRISHATPTEAVSMAVRQQRYTIWGEADLVLQGDADSTLLILSSDEGAILRSSRGTSHPLGMGSALLYGEPDDRLAVSSGSHRPATITVNTAPARHLDVGSRDTYDVSRDAADVTKAGFVIHGTPGQEVDVELATEEFSAGALPAFPDGRLNFIGEFQPGEPIAFGIELNSEGFGLIWLDLRSPEGRDGRVTIATKLHEAARPPAAPAVQGGTK